MHNKTLSLATCAALLAGPAVAEQTYLTYGLDYRYTEAFGSTLQVLTGFGGAEYDFGAFGLNAEVSFRRVANDTDALTINEFKLVGDYEVAPGFVVFAGAESFSFEGNSSTDYLLGAEYQTGPLTFAASYSVGEDFDPDTGLTTLLGSYQLSESTELYLSLQRFGSSDEIPVTLGVDYSSGPIDAVAMLQFSDGDTVIAGDISYEFGGHFRGLANVIFFDDSSNGYSVGLGYEVADNTWVELTGSRVNSGSIVIDQIGLSLTFETGRQGRLVERAEDNQERSFRSLSSIVF